MNRRSPAQRYALVIGWTLVLAGIVGFFYNADFGSGSGTERDAVFGVLDVNGWHNLVHISTGVLGLLVAGQYDGARTYAISFGVIYLVVAGLGFSVGDGSEVLSIVPVNTEDNLLHLFIGLAGVLSWLASPAIQAPTTDGGG